MAITDKETGVWGLDQVYNKINQGSIWEYSGAKQLWAAGYGVYGGLGNNTSSPSAMRSSPVQIPGTWDGILVGGDESAFATKSDGTLWTWGRNNNGDLGQNNLTDRSSPVQIPGTTWPLTDQHKMSFSGSTAAAIKTDGTLWTWGSNYKGGIGAPGVGGDDKRSSPTQVPGTTWSKISTGTFSQCAIKTDGTMWTWGSNVYGNLGTNQHSTAFPDYDGAQTYSSPVQIPGTSWSKIPQTCKSSRCAIRTDGTLWAWGYNGDGQLGQNEQGAYPGFGGLYSSPVQIPGTTWNDVWTGAGGSLFIATKTDNTLWAWGYNGNGELGQNTQGDSRSSPVQIPGTTWNKVSTGGNLVIASKTDGTYWSWGSSYYGHAGNNTRGPAATSGISSPTQVPGDYLNIVVGSSLALFNRNA